MRNNPRRTARQSNPWSLERARRDRTVTIIGAAQPEGVFCLDTRNSTEMMVSELDCYVATMNSWCRLDQQCAHGDVLREMLQAGTTVANSKGLFYIPEAKERRQAEDKTCWHRTAAQLVERYNEISH